MLFFFFFYKFLVDVNYTRMFARFDSPIFLNVLRVIFFLNNKGIYRKKKAHNSTEFFFYDFIFTNFF